MSNAKRKALAAQADAPPHAEAQGADYDVTSDASPGVIMDGGELAPDVDANNDPIAQVWDELLPADGNQEFVARHEAMHEALTHPLPTTNVAQMPAPQPADEQAFANARAIPGDNSKLVTAKRGEIILKVRKLGEALGKGDTSLVGLAAVMCKGGRDGYLTHVPQKGQKKGVKVEASDARTMYLKFRDARALARGMVAPEDQSEESLAAQVSKLANFIKLGCSSEQFIEPQNSETPYATDACELLDKVVELHKQFSSPAEKQSLKVTSAYEAMQRIAKAQLKVAYWMTEDEVLDELLKADEDAAPKTALDFVKAALASAEKARDGKQDSATSEGRAPLSHEHLDHAISWLCSVINELDPAFIKARQDAEAEALAKEQAKLAKAQDRANQPKRKKAA